MAKNPDTIVARDNYDTLYDLKKHKEVYGSCKQWKDFLASDVTSNAINFKPIGIEFLQTEAIVNELQMLTCSDAVATAMINTMIAYSTSTDVSSSQFACDNSNTWTVMSFNYAKFEEEIVIQSVLLFERFRN